MPLTTLRRGIAKELYNIILPYYKGGLPIHGEVPEFRRALSGDEINTLLSSIHNLVQDLLKEDK